MKEDSLADSLRAFASSSLSAGGGGAAALTGALGAALLCMVARITLKRDPDSDLGYDLVGLLEQGTTYQRELEELMERDPQSYRRVSKALKELRNNPEARLELLEALKEATRVPLDTAINSLGCLHIAVALADIGAPETITEVATGAYLCHAALQSALCTAATNLKDIEDPIFIARACGEVAELSAGEVLVDKVATRVAELTGMDKTFRVYCPNVLELFSTGHSPLSADRS